jgi:hypothetical protein
MKIRFDVSELKTFKECGRKWELSSRNAYHLRPRVAAPNLVFGTLFHEALHGLYAAAEPNVDGILETLMRELTGDAVAQKVMTTMIKGYYSGPLQDDKAKYKILDIERGFEIPVPELYMCINPESGEIVPGPDVVVICGSIDMIAIDRETNAVWGFEHKSCKNFRTDVYHMLDEQPKMYYLALKQIIDELNAKKSQETPPYILGGLIVNEVKKLSNKFEYQRRICKYSIMQQAKFYSSVLHFGEQIVKAAQRMEHEDLNLPTSPSYLKCAMCDYANICSQYGDDNLELEVILDEFAEEYQVREVDHLDEKMERAVDEQ